eukprot:jgi/Astpho2/1817/e_gw1.00038.394.1_t
MHFFQHPITNIYQGLPNVILRLEPAGKTNHGMTVKGLLVASHFDAGLGSPGASDAASCIGVMLEMARALAADGNSTLAAPVVFLFNGGEETLSQAAHGFMQHSAHAQNLGAFINLESTGPAGPDFLFQSSGDWVVDAFATAAPRPRGSVVGQDFFRAKLIPADTDFRMFSWTDYGHLPGLDIAFLLDGTAYHTTNDRPERIRAGTLQVCPHLHVDP